MNALSFNEFRMAFSEMPIFLYVQYSQTSTFHPIKKLGLSQDRSNQVSNQAFNQHPAFLICLPNKAQLNLLASPIKSHATTKIQSQFKIQSYFWHTKVL